MISIWIHRVRLSTNVRAENPPKLLEKSAKTTHYSLDAPLPHEIGRRRVGTQMFILMYCIFFTKVLRKAWPGTHEMAIT